MSQKVKHIYLFLQGLAHQNRTIAIASAFRVDGIKLPEIPQKERVSGSEIASLNRNAALFCRLSEIARPKKSHDLSGNGKIKQQNTSSRAPKTLKHVNNRSNIPLGAPRLHL